MATENNNKTLNVPNMRFPEFSGEWERSSLGVVFCKVENGLTYDPNNSEGLPVTRIETISDRSINYKRVGYAKDDGKLSKYKMEPGDILFSHINSLKHIGKTAYYDGEHPLYHGMNLLLLRTTNEESARFLFYQLNTSRFLHRCQVLANQAVNQASINTRELKGITLHKPSIKEQIKIADFISLLDNRIATQIKIIEKLESLIRGISNNLLYSESGTPVRLGDILSERSERTKVNNQHEVLSSTVKGIFSQREYFSKDIASENNVGYKVIRLHDVVLSPQNLWMGNINYNDKFDIGIVSPSYKIFSIADGYDKRFVAAMLKTHRALYNYMLVSEQGASVVRRNLNMEAFEQLVFKMPPIDKQREIGNAISALQSRLELAVRVKTAYERQKQWLLTEMFI